jgi:hypothetical protein
MSIAGMVMPSENTCSEAVPRALVADTVTVDVDEPRMNAGTTIVAPFDDVFDKNTSGGCPLSDQYTGPTLVASTVCVTWMAVVPVVVMLCVPIALTDGVAKFMGAIGHHRGLAAFMYL